MSGYAGVARILRFNWPWYAGALVVTTVGIAALGWWLPPGPWPTLAAAGLGLANGWLLLSLAVSHHIYDRSAIARGGWLDLPAANVVVVHAGHDEASAHVARLLPGAGRHVFDIFDPARRASPSLLRARAEATVAATAADLGHLPVADASADLALLIFAAHEIRDEARRVGCFRELARVVGPRGRIVVVEHQRDAWNLLAYGPGFLHFLSRRAWMRTFADAGLVVARDDAITPWVHRYELRTSA